MNSLILDCSAGMSIYILSGEEVFYKIDQNQKKHTDELLLSVDELLARANLSLQQIDNLCVCVGPGSFTGIRVAVSVCKGLAVGTNAKIFSASNFDIYSFSKTENSFFVLEGFSDFVYVRKIENGKIKDECLPIDECVKLLKKKKFEVFAQNEKTQNLLLSYEIHAKIAENETISLFKDKISKNEFCKINEISPIYLRASQAEIERNKKLGAN